jgi:DNA polymerase III delta prime subunit
VGSFLFLGPTGVGKTEPAKALAELLFGGKDRMIRFDMSECDEKGLNPEARCPDHPLGRRSLVPFNAKFPNGINQ